MAHSRTARKNIRKSERRRAENKGALSTLRTRVKQVRKAVAAKDGPAAQAALPHAQKVLDKAAKAHRIHPNKAARLKSRLAKAAHKA